TVALRLFVYRKSSALRSVDIGVIIGLVYIVASSPLFPWSVFPFNKLNFIQMAWRLFEFTSFFFAVAGGYYLSLILKSNGRKLVTAFTVVILLVLIMVNDAKSYEMYRCGRPITQVAAFNNDYHLGGLEYIPSAVPSIEYLHQRGDSIGTLYEGTSITNFRRIKGVTSFDINATGNIGSETLELPLIYYKGYVVKQDNEEIPPVGESKNGLVEILIDKPGHITVYYGGTPIQKISYFITLAGILAICIYILLQRRNPTQGINTDNQ
ncbi:MAG: hypothetical protein ACK5KN_15535, partial [Dysgonomonas sp.]